MSFLVPYRFQPGDIVNAHQINANFDSLLYAVNALLPPPTAQSGKWYILSGATLLKDADRQASDTENDRLRADFRQPEIATEPGSYFVTTPGAPWAQSSAYASQDYASDPLVSWSPLTASAVLHREKQASSPKR